MFETIKRPLSEKERRHLRLRLDSLKRMKAVRIKRGIVAGLVLFLVLWSITLFLSKSSWPEITIFWLACGTGITGWVIIQTQVEIRSRARRISDAIRANTVEAIRVRSDRMVEMEEIEDEGACYAFQIDEERILFICGQEFYSTARFPCSDFSIVTIQDSSGGAVDEIIEKHGPHLHPQRTIPASQKKKLRWPEHLEVVNGSLDRVEELLKASSV